jgi:hypothetical protein
MQAAQDQSQIPLDGLWSSQRLQWLGIRHFHLPVGPAKQEMPAYASSQITPLRTRASLGIYLFVAAHYSAASEIWTCRVLVEK